MSPSIRLVPIDIDAFDAMQSCMAPNCSDYASFRVVRLGEGPARSERMCYAHAHAVLGESQGPKLPRTAARCDSCGHLVEATAGLCPQCGRPTRQVPVDASGAPIWLGDGGWYD